MLRSAARLADIEPFHVVELLTRARQLEAEGRDIIHMEIGEPDFPTPEPIVNAAVDAIKSGKTLYTQALGLPELRAAISDFYCQRYGVSVPAARIAITNGASGALNLAFACLADPGSEWLLTDPGYPCNRHILRTYEGRPQSIAVGPESNFQPTAAQVSAAWNERTAGLLVASPANPTGTLLTLPEIAALADVCRQNNGHFLVDEIYHGLTYAPSPKGTCFAAKEIPLGGTRSNRESAPGFAAETTACSAGDDIWVINSFSKYFQMTGWRLGWMVIPEAFVRDVEKLAQNLVLCASTPAQYAALAAFQPETIAILEERRAEFRRRRDFLAPALEAIGFRVTARPEGAFYLYCDCSALAADSFTLARDLLEKTGVAATPGLDFGSNAPEKHIRFAYTTGVDRLAEAVERLRRYFGR
ncbi:pyridoxal phosphate-dependent aminotransferase [Azonexus sp.]|uniref:pyridoxal phosphate-dependent aminotransferase n=1 Tax=Azonexus sp. TaxID=1872668 RepID=UPI0027BAECAD|nr:pyridoxal phosphate-dependent aminotransferase [Azonexus sp.]